MLNFSHQWGNGKASYVHGVQMWCPYVSLQMRCQFFIIVVIHNIDFTYWIHLMTGMIQSMFHEFVLTTTPWDKYIIVIINHEQNQVTKESSKFSRVAHLESDGFEYEPRLSDFRVMVIMLQRWGCLHFSPEPFIYLLFLNIHTTRSF